MTYTHTHTPIHVTLLTSQQASFHGTHLSRTPDSRSESCSCTLGFDSVMLGSTAESRNIFLPRARDDAISSRKNYHLSNLTHTSYTSVFNSVPLKSPKRVPSARDRNRCGNLSPTLLFWEHQETPKVYVCSQPRELSISSRAPRKQNC